MGQDNQNGQGVMRLETLATHAGRDDLRELGLHAPPIDLSTTYPVRELDDAVDSLSALAEGARGAAESVYSRLHSPTVRRFELALAALEGADDAVGFASGMAAVTAALLAAGPAGRHVVAIRPIYGTTDHLLTSGLLGGRVTWAGAAEVADAIRPDTGLVLLETPANPTLDLVDIADVVRQAGRVPVAVDSTFATPILQQPLRHGAALAIHSATKFLGGHGDVLAGVVACSDEWATRLRQVRVATGAVLSPPSRARHPAGPGRARATDRPSPGAVAGGARGGGAGRLPGPAGLSGRATPR